MAEKIKESPLKQNGVHETKPEVLISNNIQNDMHNGCNKKIEKSELISDEADSRVIQEKNKLLKITTDLQEIIINLLQQKFKLLDMKNKKFKNDMINAVEDVQKAVNEALRNFLNNSEGNKSCELQQILKFIDSLNVELEKDFTDNIEKILDETHGRFSIYLETYTNSNDCLENFIQTLEELMKIGHSPKSFQIQQCVLFSIFEENVVSYKAILKASKKSFNEFESIMKNELKISEDINKRLDILLVAFEKAEFAYSKLKSLTFELLKFDYAKV